MWKSDDHLWRNTVQNGPHHQPHPLTSPSGLFVPVSPRKARSVPGTIPKGKENCAPLSWLMESSETRATAFNEQVDKFFPLTEVSKVYYFSKGTLKIVNKQFTAVKNDYKMTLSNDHLPTIKFTFTGINPLKNKSKDSLVDIHNWDLQELQGCH